MNNFFTQINIKTLLQLNIVSIVIIAFCDVFAFAIFLSKGFQDGVETWKFILYLSVVVFITLFLIGSVVSLIYFFKLKKKNNH